MTANESRYSAEIARLRTLVTSKGNTTMVALALTASDLPQQRCRVMFDDAVAFAVQGLMRLGVDAARQRADAPTGIALTDIRLIDAGLLATDPRRRELARCESTLRGVSQRRFMWCNDVACSLILTDDWAARSG